MDLMRRSLVRRIDVGPHELTIDWLFMEGGKRRIDRNSTDPKRGKGKPLKYNPGVLGKDLQQCTSGRNTRKKAPSGARDGRMVEIGANRQSCDPSITLLLKLVLEVVLGISCGAT
jgi:hypothetical protein